MSSLRPKVIDRKIFRKRHIGEPAFWSDQTSQDSFRYQWILFRNSTNIGFKF